MTFDLGPARASRLRQATFASTALASLIAGGWAGGAWAQGASIDVAPIDVTARQRRPAVRPKPKPPVARAAPAPRARVARAPVARPAPPVVAPRGPLASQPGPGGAGAPGLSNGGEGGRAEENASLGISGYVATRETAATKTNTPVREVPQSISTVTRQQIEDRNAQTLNEAVNYTPSATTNASGTLVDFDRFYIRGFDATTSVYRDNLRQGGAGFGIPRVEPYGLQSLTILRGPAAGLYGLGSPGGIVDVTTKRPTFTAFNEVGVQIGQYNRRQVNFDLSGPAPDTTQFAYRLTGLAREAGTNLPGEPDNRAYIAPAFTWRPDADTRVTVLAEYLNSRVSGNSLFNTDPRTRRIRYYENDPAFGAFDQSQARVGYEIEHRVDDLLTLRQNARYTHVFADSKFTFFSGVDEAAGIASRVAGVDRDVFNAVALDNQAEWRFRTGFIDHTLLTGLNYNHFFNVTKYGTGAAPDLDLLTLNYGAQAIARPSTYSYVQRQTLDELGLYAQDQARLGNFILTLTGQQSFVWNTSDTLGVVQDTKENAFVGRVGLSYLLDGGLAPYVSYATSYNPQIGADAAGTAFPSTTGEQIEGGVKYQVPGLPILLSTAAFEITQDNVLRTDPANFFFQAATGQVRSKGVEFEASVSLAEGLNLIAAYSHLDVRITRGATDTTGNRFSGIPEDSAALFAKYTFQPGSILAGLSVGAGFRYLGGSFGNDQNTFRNQATTLMDAVLSYDLGIANRRFEGARFQINATNLLDTRFQACQSGFCGLGEPQRIVGSLVYRF